MEYGLTRCTAAMRGTNRKSKESPLPPSARASTHIQLLVESEASCHAGEFEGVPRARAAGEAAAVANGVLLATFGPLADQGGVPTKAVERVRRRVDRESGGRHGGTGCCVLRKKVREKMVCMRQPPRPPKIQIKPVKTWNFQSNFGYFGEIHGSR